MDSAKEVAEKVHAATGWRPPIMYDISTDDWRLATQEDIDRLLQMSRAYGETVVFLKQRYEALVAACQPK
jgi:hypothetical protein